MYSLTIILDDRVLGGRLQVLTPTLFTGRRLENGNRNKSFLRTTAVGAVNRCQSHHTPGAGGGRGVQHLDLLALDHGHLVGAGRRCEVGHDPGHFDDARLDRKRTEVRSFRWLI